MPVFKSPQAESEAILTAAKLILAAVTTSPKTRGISSLTTAVLQGEEQERLAKAMEDPFNRKHHKLNFLRRDAQSIRRSAAILLIGVKGAPEKPEDPINCGGCGFSTCRDFLRAAKKKGEDFVGPLCIFQVLDLGVATKMAAAMNIDNRLMYSAGAAAMNLEILEADLILALPLSVSPKNIFFDRPS
jgi:uncharacterized ferredoxin-like protein